MAEKNRQKSIQDKSWLSKNKWSLIVLAAAALIFIAARIFAASGVVDDRDEAGEYAEYETGTVLAVLSDTTEADENADGAFRGEQSMTVKVTSGRYEGEELLVQNFVGPLYGVPVSEGDSVTMIISTHGDGSHSATVYEYNRESALIIVIAVFLLVTVLVGGKTGAKSLVGLILTFVCIIWILIPLLLKGLPTLPTVFFVCALVTAVCFVILGGVGKKTACAALGTICGVAIAMLFGLAAQALVRIDGLRAADVEPLLQLRQTGTPIGLENLLVGGIIISALGAVMDVAMSISSAITEIHSVDPKLGQKELFKSGMNIGRDMVGTMTNTLILAFIGSSFVLVIYLCSLGLETHQLLSSSYLAIEVVSGIASSIGVILSVPITALLSSAIISK